MGDLKRVAFQSLNLFKDYLCRDGAVVFDRNWIETVLSPGMKFYLKHTQVTPRIWVDLREDDFFADVHLELRDEKGEVTQPWVLTFYLRKFYIPDEMGPAYWSFPSAPGPFPEGPFLIEGDEITRPILKQHMNHWASYFWPDWEPEFKWGMVSDVSHRMKEALTDLLGHPSIWSLYMITPSSKVTPSVYEWLQRKGVLVYIASEDGYLVRATEEIMQNLREQWPELRTDLFDLIEI